MMQSPGKTYLLLEAVVVFIGIPLLFYLEWIPIPKLGALLVVAGYCAFILWKDSGFTTSILTKIKADRPGRQILARVSIVSILLLILVILIQPTQLLAFPSVYPARWLMVMAVYPLLSALPQELIYRSYFFHRYRGLISDKYNCVIASALLFAFLHLVYDNWWAIGLSFIAGLLFGMTYLRTRSLFWVTVEHVLYGWLVFTLGLGNFFYEPM